LKSSLNVVDFDTDKTNIKQLFLSDENGDDFPWSDKFKTKHLEIDNNNKTNENEQTDLKPSNTHLENYKPYKMLNEILDNLIMINRIFPHSTKSSQKQKINKNGYNFLFILFGSNDSPLNKLIVENLIEFWKVFHLKHKFLVVYLNFDRSNKVLNEFPILPWYTIFSREHKVSLNFAIYLVFHLVYAFLNFKIKICENYGVKSVPKLLILDMRTGDLLNNNLRLGIIRYIHYFCNKQIETAKLEENKTQAEKKKSELIKENETFHFNFDFDMYDICTNGNGKSSRKKNNKTKTLDVEFLKELNENLIDLKTRKFINLNCNQNENGMNTFYLLYFCSNFTASNANIFENVIKFLQR
jgi:hypothetical protein